MRGLIYRELYLGRKTYMIGLLTVFLFVILGVLVRFSLAFGNLAELETDAYEFVNLASYYGFSYLPIVLLAVICSSDGGVTVSDYKSKWCLYFYTLPVKEQKQALVKFCIKIGQLLLIFLLGVGNLALFAALNGRRIETGSMKLLLIIIMLAAVISSALTPLMIRYKTLNAAIIRIEIAALVIGFGFVFWLRGWFEGFQEAHKDFSYDDLADVILQAASDGRDLLAGVAPLVLILALILGYLFTVRQLKKREVA